jgi:predicted nucleic acid-binding protein
LKTAVDSNILFDFLGASAAAADAAEAALLVNASSGPVVLCDIVYAEVAAGFQQPDQLTRMLRTFGITIESLTLPSLWRAAEAWSAYLRRRGQQLICPRCGQPFSAACPACQAPLVWRQHIITDFLIGGHALMQADQLLTRDRGYYRTYFPQLRLIAP